MERAKSPKQSTKNKAMFHSILLVSMIKRFHLVLLFQLLCLAVGNVGDPALPEIIGPFSVQLKVRFNAISASEWQTLFEYSRPDNDNDTIWFGMKSNQFRLRVYADGIQETCTKYDNREIGVLYTIKFEVEANGAATVYIDGVERVSCSRTFPIPNHISRNHYVGEGVHVDPTLTTVALRGAILGLQVHNIGSSESFFDRIKYENYPGQPFDSSFVASFYGRIDSIGNQRKCQRIFDFADADGSNSMYCGQWGFGYQMPCGVRQAYNVYYVNTENILLQNVFAFWRFSVETNGTMWIEKDGVVVQTENHAFQPAIPFLNDALFGRSHDTKHHDLDGVALSVRIDVGSNS